MSYLFPLVLCKLPEEKDGYLFIYLFFLPSMVPGIVQILNKHFLDKIELLLFQYCSIDQTDMFDWELWLEPFGIYIYT